jgi:hypothetical protein
MPTASKKAAASAPAKAKRKQLTPAERIAKAEAELEALRKKAAEQGTKKASVIDAKLKVLVDKRTKLNEQITALETAKAGLLPSEEVDASDDES